MSYTLSTHYHANSQNARIRYLVLHYTAVDFSTALHLLTEGTVSAHYLIPETDAPASTVYQLVAESARAWHAGESYWQGSHALNDSSIGIELVNHGFTEHASHKIWHPFAPTQIATLIELVQDIMTRHVIHPTCVVGHSDIAPTRKMDPGPLFPWKTLFERGIGAWPNEATVNRHISVFERQPVSAAWLQQHLHDYGYAVTLTGEWDSATRAAISAFQMHFRPLDYSGIADAQTCAILVSLLERYGKARSHTPLTGHIDAETPALPLTPPPTNR